MHEDELKTKKHRVKISLVGLVFVFFFLAITIRSYQLQILTNTRLDNLANSQYKTKLLVSPRRGAIYDRNGNVLALDILVSSVGINPHLVDNKLKAREIFAKHTGLTLAEIDKKLNSNSKFEWIRRRIGLLDGQEIEKADLKGVQVLSEYRRYYPNKSLAGQLLGAVGYDAKALGGVELSYDKYLKSNLAKQQVERDARGKFFSPLEEINDNADVYLTIDMNIQHLAEEALAENAVKHKVKNGFALVVDVESGDLLAMANYPKFDPNVYWEYPQESWKNHAITDVFEPGSTFKTILMSAAIGSGKVKATDKFFCENGSYRIKSNVINDSHAHGWLDAKGILTVSSNIGITKIGQKIGKKIFYDFMQDVGVGKKANIGLIGETAGTLRSYTTWRDIEFSNISFGQGLSVNGLQMAGAYRAIANNGNYSSLAVVQKVINGQNEIVLDNTNRQSKEIMNKEAAGVLKDMLHSVTQPGGTAMQANIDGYLSAGKTGTAQKYDAKIKAYAANDFVSSFIGFTPLHSPRLMIYVVYDTPRTNGYYGGVVAGPVFKKIGEKSLAYLGEYPEGWQFAKNKVAVEPEATSDAVMTDRQSEVKTALEESLMPDLSGLSLRKVFDYLGEKSLRVKTSGSGVVVNQTPQPGEKIKGSGEISLVLADPS